MTKPLNAVRRFSYTQKQKVYQRHALGHGAVIIPYSPSAPALPVFVYRKQVDHCGGDVGCHHFHTSFASHDARAELVGADVISLRL